jgi:nucleotide-binding universal stress UspA family protein
MAAVIKPSWSKPSTILFASEIPANEKSFGFALAQSAELGADLILFHAHEGSDVAASEMSSGPNSGGTAITRDSKYHLELLAQRARDVGVRHEVVVRRGCAASQILSFLRERKIDRVVMGARTPGPVGKLLVGSVAETVLRSANAPVCIVGPYVVEGSYQNRGTRKVLCDVGKEESGRVVVNFGAELAAVYKASLILHQVIPPQERAQILGDRTIDQMEAELPSLVPVKFKHKVRVQTRVALGDPIEEILYQGRTQQASLIVLGAQGASRFAAVTRSGIVYKVLAYAHCPVITLSPVVLAECGYRMEKPRPAEVNYMAGVI